MCPFSGKGCDGRSARAQFRVRKIASVTPDESVNRVMKLMMHHRVRHMPVLQGGRLVGIVSIGDVVKHRLEDLELETSVLRDVYHAAR